MSISDYAQFITVLIIFVMVLVVAAFVTKKVGKVGNLGNRGTNVSVVESYRISSGSYIQIIKIGTQKYIAIAVSKESVTKLAELTEDELTLNAENSADHTDFKGLLELFCNKNNSGNGDK